MRKPLVDLCTEPFTAEQEWTVEGIPVLQATVSLPNPTDAKSPLSRRIRRYYRLQCRSYLRYCEHCLFPIAAEAYREALAISAPLPLFRAELTYRVTFNESGLWRLYTQSREISLPGQTLLRRWGDTWDLAEGFPLSISAFFPPRSNWRRQLLTQTAEEICRREAAGTALFREDWRRRLRRSFNNRNFYLTAEGLAFFFPMYALAPAAEGIPTFPMPYRGKKETGHPFC